MPHTIIVGDKKIVYKIKKSTRAKHVRISISRDGEVVITAPVRVSQQMIFDLVQSKKEWIASKVLTTKKERDPNLVATSQLHFISHKKEALHLIKKKVEHWNQYYNFKYNTISIKKLKTRWGSCSTKKNLNFNYKILFLPEKMQDYIIIHELSHLKEMNHSHRFWSVVQECMPDYKEVKRELRNL